MPIQAVDTNASIVVANDYDRWVIKAGVNVVVSGGSTHAIDVDKSGVAIQNFGNLSGAVGIEFSNEKAAIAGYVFNAEGATISGRYDGVAMQASGEVDNAGFIQGGTGIRMYGDYNTIVNSGQIIAGDGIYAAGFGVTLHNSGSIVATGEGVALSNDATSMATIFNSGLIEGKHEALRQAYVGAVDLDNSGSMVGLVNLGYCTAGSSILNTGSIHGDVRFGSGADVYQGVDGLITGSVSGGAGDDSIAGGVGADTLTGEDGADVLSGGGGNNLLTGGLGNDLIVGGAGDDVLIGGAGRDRMDGGKGPGEDTFIFTDTSDSRPSAMDVITKHWSGADTIDLSGIEANVHLAGQQHFTFGGEVAQGAALATGVIDYFQFNGNTYVVADTTGDGKADFELMIHGLQTLTASEFAV